MLVPKSSFYGLELKFEYGLNENRGTHSKTSLDNTKIRVFLFSFFQPVSPFPTFGVYVDINVSPGSINTFRKHSLTIYFVE